MNDWSDPTTKLYAVDGDDRIVSVFDAWHAANATHHLPVMEDNQIGASLWSLVTDETTRHLYSRVYENVRAQQDDITVPFRCDTPALVRSMELRVSPEPDRGLLVRTRLVAQRERPPVALLDVEHSRTSELLRMCGWCKQVHVEGRWIEVEEALAVLKSLQSWPVPSITHGMCERCETDMQRMVDRWERRTL